MDVHATSPLGDVQGGGGGIEGWQDVGGLADVQAALQEALELPTKYAALISRSGPPSLPLAYLAPHVFPYFTLSSSPCSDRASFSMPCEVSECTDLLTLHHCSCD